MDVVSLLKCCYVVTRYVQVIHIQTKLFCSDIRTCTVVQGGAKRTHVFQIIVTLFTFNIKKIMSTPKQPVINAVLITYIDYSITENYIGKMASFLPYTRSLAFRRCPLAPTLTRFICLRFSFFRVTSNQKSTFENLVQSTI